MVSAPGDSRRRGAAGDSRLEPGAVLMKLDVRVPAGVDADHDRACCWPATARSATARSTRARSGSTSTWSGAARCSRLRPRLHDPVGARTGGVAVRNRRGRSRGAGARVRSGEFGRIAAAVPRAGPREPDFSASTPTTTTVCADAGSCARPRHGSPRRRETTERSRRSIDRVLNGDGEHQSQKLRHVASTS